MSGDILSLTRAIETRVAWETQRVNRTTPGERLTHFRTKAGLSLTEAAERVGVHKSTYHQFESGRRSPTLDRLHEIAVKLGIDPHQLDERLASQPKEQ